MKGEFYPKNSTPRKETNFFPCHFTVLNIPLYLSIFCCCNLIPETEWVIVNRGLLVHNLKTASPGLGSCLMVLHAWGKCEKSHSTGEEGGEQRKRRYSLKLNSLHNILFL